ncbi:MAG: protein-glutamate O-methyltransferase [Desulfobulbaceae bacterium DB1]|nr:MAG: protein-glutamate O-methyltransferase [Desulfobulbaceae bacterium DB1]
MDISFQQSRLTDDDFKKFSTLIFSKTGIYLKPEKKELLNARLGKRLRACGITSFADYYDLVVHDASGSELVHLINCVSTNFTSFFREKAHFDFLESTVLPQFVESGRASSGMKVWSAACSSGEEPYTLAMALSMFMTANPAFRFSLLATDISTKVLSVAEKGIYSMDKMDKVPQEYLKRFFQKGVGKCAGYVKAKDELSRFVTFRRFNLMDDFPWKGEMDVIFCRNVMIYFTRETQMELVEKFYHCLAPGGYLFIGHSESLTSITNRFRQAATTVYRKIK